MTKLSVKVKGAAVVRKGLENLTAEIPQISAGRIRGRLISAQTKLKRYPSQTHNSQPFKTEKQRRWFFAALREGKITVPYQRTRRLADGWKVRKISQGRNSVGYRLENPVDYTAKVHGNAYGLGQVAYHRGNWVKMRDEVDEAVKRLPEEIEDNIQMVARRSGF